MPRDVYNKDFYAVWSINSTDCLRFVDKALYDAHVERLKSRGIFYKVAKFSSFNRMLTWFKENDFQHLQERHYLVERTKTMNPIAAKLVPLPVSKPCLYASPNPLAKILEDQNNPSYPKACIIYGDGAKKKDQRATAGIWSKELNHWECMILGEEDTHVYAELWAISRALELMSETLVTTSQTQFSKLICVSDSQYVVKMFNDYSPTYIVKYGFGGQWKTSGGDDVAYQDLIKQMILRRQHIEKIIPVEFIWVPRMYNKIADAVANGKAPPKDAFDQPPTKGRKQLPSDNLTTSSESHTQPYQDSQL
jgi:ribonuclease HI